MCEWMIEEVKPQVAGKNPVAHVARFGARLREVAFAFLSADGTTWKDLTFDMLSKRKDNTRSSHFSG